MNATLQALVAAALFGASAPLVKWLGVAGTPLVASGILYLAAGVGLLPFRRRGEAPLRRADWPLLAGVILVGGVLGPALLIFGLARASATATSLLLNLETVFTTILAVALFRESVGWRALAAMALIVAGAAALTFEQGGATRSLAGPLAVAGACACWGLDNNLTQRLSLRDPLAVVRWKGLCAGALSLAIGLAAGERLPAWRAAALVALVGAAGYGASLVLYVRALRSLGAARTGTLFATAPFAGALVAIALGGDRPSLVLGAAAAAMAGGVALLAFERHEHAHAHEALEHEHQHVHDEHHQHSHEGLGAGEPGPEPHSHPHKHEPLTHSHPHSPDLHHRHKH
ncbi:MAG TPA: EamA family transporter [Polyangia bacterium]|nr:EamA family transporter [Polyangia bacterium]